MTIILWLKQWSIRHDKGAHGLLSFLLCLLGIKFAVGFMLAIECTQIDIYGIKARWRDTLFDLVADAIGIAIYYGVGYLL
jgi:hypothetical protein